MKRADTTRPPGSSLPRGRRHVENTTGQRVSAASVGHPDLELEAWASAVDHLHALGLPAAVPEFAAAWLRRRGIHPDWTTP
jgi:hypothetical protein